MNALGPASPLADGSRAGLDRSTRLWLILAASALVLLYATVVWRSYSASIDGRRVFWLQDDMMISLRYAQNLVRGHGLVWNPGERVEGYSNFGWVLVMAAAVWLLPAHLASAGVAAVDLGLAVTVLFLSVRLLQRLAPQPGWLVPALLGAEVVASDVAQWTVMGLETPLMTAVLLALTLRVLREADAGRPTALTWLAAGLLGVIRVDGFGYAGLLCLLALALQPARRELWKRLPWLLVLPAAQLAFRLEYYGLPLSNTYYLKATGWALSDRLLAGSRYTLGLFSRYGLPIVLAAAGARASHDARGRALVLLPLGTIGYGLAAGGDAFHGARFFAPTLPVALCLAFLAPRWLGARVGSRLEGLAALALALAVAWRGGFDFRSGPSPEEPFVRAGLALRAATSPQTSIANLMAGALPYFAERPAVDLLGKCDPEVAQLPARRGQLTPGHNKFDFTRSLSRYRPDLVAVSVPPSMVLVPGAQSFWHSTDHAYIAGLYENPVFQTAYAPRLSFVERVPIFVRADAADLPRLMSGACEPITAETMRSAGLRLLCYAPSASAVTGRPAP